MNGMTDQRFSEAVKMERSSRQTSIFQTIFLHLFPGALITIAFIFLGPWLKENNLPPILSLLIPIVLVLIPFEVGFLFFQGFKRNGRCSLEGIVLNRKPIQMKEFFIYVPIVLVWAIVIFMSMAKIDLVIFNRFFGWLPDWFTINQFSSGDYTQPTLTATFILMLISNGLAGPIAEELYFRGYLLPRLESLKGWAPFVNVLLFSLYHFFSPWQNITRIIAFFPLAFVARRKQNIYIGILAHCLLNTGYCILSAPLFFS